MPNPWLEHVKKVKLQYPQLRYKDVLVKAKKSYTPVKKPAKIGLKTGGKIVITKPIIRTRKVSAAKKKQLAKDRFAVPLPQDLDEFQKRQFRELTPATIDTINRLVELNKEQMRLIPQVVDGPKDLIPILEEEGERIDEDEDEPIEIEPEKPVDPQPKPEKPIDPQPKEPKKPEPVPVPVEPKPIIPDKTRFQIIKDYLNSIDKKKVAKRTVAGLALAGLAYKAYTERQRLQALSADGIAQLTDRLYGRNQQLVPDYAYLDEPPNELPAFQGDVNWDPSEYLDDDDVLAITSDISSSDESDLSDLDIQPFDLSESEPETVFTRTAPSTPKFDIKKRRKELLEDESLSGIDRPPPHNPKWSKANLIKKSIQKRFKDLFKNPDTIEDDKMFLKGFNDHVDDNVLTPALNEHKRLYSDADLRADRKLADQRNILEQSIKDAKHIRSEVTRGSDQSFSEPTESKYDDEDWRDNESDYLFQLSDSEIDDRLRSESEHNDDFVSDFIDDILLEAGSEVRLEEAISEVRIQEERMDRSRDMIKDWKQRRQVKAQIDVNKDNLRSVHNELIEKSQMKKQVKELIEDSLINDLTKDQKIGLLVQDPEIFSDISTEFSSITPDSDIPVQKTETKTKTKTKSKSKSKKKAGRKARQKAREIKGIGILPTKELDNYLEEIRREFEEQQRQEGEAFDAEFQRQEVITNMATILQKVAGKKPRGGNKDIDRQDYVNALKKTILNIKPDLIKKDIADLKEQGFKIVNKRGSPKMIQKTLSESGLVGMGFKQLKDHILKESVKHHMKKLNKMIGGSIIDLVKAGVQTGKKIKGAIDKGMKIAEVAKRVLMDNNLRKFVHKFLGPDNDYPSFKDELHAILRLPNKKFKLASYMGPFTQVRKRLKHQNKDGSMGIKPLTQSDTVAMLHDIQYSLARNINDIRKADKTMLKYLKKIKSKNLDTKMNIAQGMKLIEAKVTAEDMDLLARDGFIDFYDTIPENDIQMLKMWEDKIKKKLDKL